MPSFSMYDKRGNLIWSDTTFSLGDVLGPMQYVGGNMFLMAGPSGTSYELWMCRLDSKNKLFHYVKRIKQYTAGDGIEIRGVAYDGKQIILTLLVTASGATRIRQLDWNGNETVTEGTGTFEIGGVCFDSKYICSLKRPTTSNFRRYFRSGTSLNLVNTTNVGTFQVNDLAFDRKGFWMVGEGIGIRHYDERMNLLNGSGLTLDTFDGIMTDGKSLFTAAA